MNEFPCRFKFFLVFSFLLARSQGVFALSLSLSFFLPGFGVTHDPQALGPPDRFWMY